HPTAVPHSLKIPAPFRHPDPPLLPQTDSRSGSRNVSGFPAPTEGLPEYSPRSHLPFHPVLSAPPPLPPERPRLSFLPTASRLPAGCPPHGFHVRCRHIYPSCDAPDPESHGSFPSDPGAAKCRCPARQP